jgi:hypothetical protein
MAATDMTSPDLAFADVAEIVADWTKAMEGVTPGPYQVVEGRFPWRLPATESPPRAEKSGEHVERQICTIAHHPQTKAPWQVVCCADGVGDGASVHFVRIEKADADWFARCSPDRIAALLTTLQQVLRERDEARAQRAAANNEWRKDYNALAARAEAADAEIARKDAALALADDLIRRAEEELRLIRMKDCDRIYDTTLRLGFGLWPGKRDAALTVKETTWKMNW